MTAPKKPKFTFKKQKPFTGLMAVGNPDPDTTIKHDRMEVGYISAPNWQVKDNKWAIRLMVEGSQDNPNNNWHWIGIKQRFDDEPQARQWLQDNVERVLNLNLHHEPPQDD